jgi:hypothetical protein
MITPPSRSLNLWNSISHLQRNQSGADDVFEDALPRAGQRQYPGE